MATRLLLFCVSAICRSFDLNRLVYPLICVIWNINWIPIGKTALFFVLYVYLWNNLLFYFWDSSTVPSTFSFLCNLKITFSTQNSKIFISLRKRAYFPTKIGIVEWAHYFEKSKQTNKPTCKYTNKRDMLGADNTPILKCIEMLSCSFRIWSFDMTSFILCIHTFVWQ